MEEKKVEKKKLTYEELENVCHQLSEQSRTLYQRLQDAELSNAFRRLDYLFEVLTHEETFYARGKEDFIDKCVDEIVTAMTVPEPEETKKEE